MKTAILSTLLAVATLAVLHAQERLVPEAGLPADPDEYDSMVEKVFATAYSRDVVCRVVILASFAPEQAVGIRKTRAGYEVFSMSPSSTIWDLELIKMYESGHLTSLGKDGKTLPMEHDKSYLALKKRAPSDYRKITTATKAVPIDKALTDRIAAIWKRMLMAARKPKEPNLGCDGTIYHFSMFVPGRGEISGQIWSPDEKTKPGALVELSEVLAGYAMKRVDMATLKETVDSVEKITGE